VVLGLCCSASKSFCRASSSLVRRRRILIGISALVIDWLAVAVVGFVVLSLAAALMRAGSSHKAGETGDPSNAAPALHRPDLCPHRADVEGAARLIIMTG